MDLLVISSDSRQKKHEAVVDCDKIDSTPLLDLLAKYPENVTTAADMYCGEEHLQVMDGVRYLRKIATVEWRILSGGFGLLRANTEIPASDCRFDSRLTSRIRKRAERAGYDVDGMTDDEVYAAVAEEIGIPDDLRQVLAGGYDLIFIILTRPYLLSIADILTELPEQSVAYAYTETNNRDLLGECEWITATEAQRQSLGTTRRSLRGRMFANFASRVGENELERVQNDPGLVQQLSS